MLKHSLIYAHANYQLSSHWVKNLLLNMRLIYHIPHNSR